VPADFDTIAMLVVNGDYRATALRQTNWAARDALNASPTRVVGPMTVWDVDTPGFRGGKFLGMTHMNMLGTNNLEVFDLMLGWAKQNIPNQPGPQGCH
jgi:hypothetical protein